MWDQFRELQGYSVALQHKFITNLIRCAALVVIPIYLSIYLSLLVTADRQGALRGRQRAATVCSELCTGRGRLIVAEQRCSAACWDSVASRLSLLPGIICLTSTRNGKDRIYCFAQLRCMNVSRNATEKSCLRGELFMVRDGFVGVASCQRWASDSAGYFERIFARMLRWIRQQLVKLLSYLFSQRQDAISHESSYLTRGLSHRRLYELYLVGIQQANPTSQLLPMCPKHC